MEQFDVVDSINNAGTWLVRNQELLLSYAVNIVAAIAIIIVGMIAARIVSNTVNRVMLARHIDATVADFLLRWCAMALSPLPDCRTGPCRCTDRIGHRRARCRRSGYWSGAAGFALEPGGRRAAGHLPSVPLR
jgi:hypothetical protein